MKMKLRQEVQNFLQYGKGGMPHGATFWDCCLLQIVLLSEGS